MTVFHPVLEAYPVAVRLDQAIVLNRGDPDEWRGSISQLIADNADGLGDDELADICDALANSRVYTGGGGAAPTFTVERDPVLHFAGGFSEASAAVSR